MKKYIGSLFLVFVSLGFCKINSKDEIALDIISIENTRLYNEVVLVNFSSNSEKENSHFKKKLCK